MEDRVFALTELAQFDAKEPQKVMVYQTDKNLGAMWCLEPGQEVFLHQTSQCRRYLDMSRRGVRSLFCR